MADYWFPVDLEPHYAFIEIHEYAKWHTHQCHDSSEANNQLSSVQSLSRVWLFVTKWTAACQASLSITKLLELTQTHVHRVDDAIQPSHPLVIPISSCLQSFPSSGSFPMSQFFISGGQSIGVSASHSVLPTNIQDWFPLGWTGWISLQSKDSQAFSPTPQFESINSSVLSFLYSPTLTSIHDD